jgi:hypothetical protein
MKKILLGAAAVLLVASGLLYWGSSFATNMVHDQLKDQHISFGTKDALEKEGEPKEITKYAGQDVDSGPKAKAYSEYIKGHLAKVANGKTYSEVSAEFQKDKTNKTLDGQRTTLFQGETLRGLLLNAWGWGLIGAIAMYASVALLLVAAALFAYSMVDKPKAKKKSAKK